MITINVLEDDLLQQSRIEKILRRVLSEQQIDYRSLGIFGRSDQLIDAATERGYHQVFFLDIEIKGEEKKGLEVAQAIRKKDPNASIIFVSTHSEFLPVTFRYKVAALDFIDKTIGDEEFAVRIAEVLEAVQERQENTVAEDSFVFETKQSVIQVPYKSIYFIETSPVPHKLVLHTRHERIEFYGKLSDVLKADERLYKCHKSFAINVDNVVRVDKKAQQVFFENEATCTVSRLKQNALIEKIRTSGAAGGMEVVV